MSSTRARHALVVGLGLAVAVAGGCSSTSRRGGASHGARASKAPRASSPPSAKLSARAASGDAACAQLLTPADPRTREPSALFHAIDFYRTALRGYCTSSDRAHASLAIVFSLAETLGREAADQAFRTRAPEQLEELAPAISASAPLVVCGYLGEEHGAHCHPDFAGFARLSKSSIPGEARLFSWLDRHHPASSLFTPWIKPTWDSGGCVRHESFDFAASLAALASIRPKIQAPELRLQIDHEQADLLESLAGYEGPDPDICTCKSKPAVKAALDKALARLAPIPDAGPARERIQSALARIAAGKLVVKSEAEAHCSGG